MTTQKNVLARHPYWSMFATLMMIIIPLAAVADAKIGTERRQNARLEKIVFDLTTERLDRQVEQCERTNSGRAALQAVLDQVAKPPASGVAAVDFTQIVGFDDLDPSVQFFLANLQIELAPSASVPSEYLTTIAANYRKSNSQQDCVALEKDLRRDLDLATDR